MLTVRLLTGRPAATVARGTDLPSRVRSHVRVVRPVLLRTPAPERSGRPRGFGRPGAAGCRAGIHNMAKCGVVDKKDNRIVGLFSSTVTAVQHPGEFSEFGASRSLMAAVANVVPKAEAIDRQCAFTL
jgi:hypothetical protein